MRGISQYGLLLVAIAILIVGAGLVVASCRSNNANPPVDDTQNTDDQNPQNTGGTDTGIDIDLPGIDSPTGDSNTPQAGGGTGLPDPSAARPLLAAELEEATEAIQQLQSDAVLKLISMKFVNSFADRGGLVTNYFIFSSPQNPQYYYLVNVPRNGEKMKRFIMPVEDLELPFDLLDLPFEFWKLSYIEAIQLAEQKGGATFRSQHSNKFEVSTILAKPAGQYLNWFVTYRATDSSGATFKVSVDAFTGEATIVN